jgi:hypothetical protein
MLTAEQAIGIIISWTAVSLLYVIHHAYKSSLVKLGTQSRYTDSYNQFQDDKNKKKPEEGQLATGGWLVYINLRANTFLFQEYIYVL